MWFEFECPSCRATVEVDASLSGKHGQCPQCSSAIAVPYFQIGPGATIGGFRLLRGIGKGGMGEVYLAEQLSMEREVAVKILPATFVEDEEAVGRFVHEVRTAARLNHPNIVTAYEAGEDNGVYFFAMAYVDGENLADLLSRRGRLPEAEALQIAESVAKALAYAWKSHELLHRDVKPANIMIDSSGQAQLMDLGLAKGMAEDTGLSISGMVLGTPHYMSPEQARGGETLDARADIYSLGATLYHLVTGHTPYPGTAALEVLGKVLNEPLTSPQEHEPSLSNACAHLIETMMAKDRDKRYADWDTVLADIARVAHGDAPTQPHPDPEHKGHHQPTARERRVLAQRAQAALVEKTLASGKKHVGAAKKDQGQTRPAKQKSKLPLVVALAAVALILCVLAVAIAVQKSRRPAVAAKPAAPAQKTFTTKPAENTPDETTPADATASPPEVQAGSQQTAEDTGSETGGDRTDTYQAPVYAEPQAQDIPTTTNRGADPEEYDRISIPHTGNWALRFDSNDDALVIPGLVLDGTHPLTIELVVKPSKDEETIEFISKDCGIGLSLAGHRKVWRADARQKDGTWVAADSRGLGHPGAPVHLATCWDGTLLRLFINGKLAGEAILQSLETHGAPLTIGMRLEGGAANETKYRGQIECVRISRAVRYSEPFEMVFPLESDADTLCLLDLENGQGDVATDTSGNGKNGRILGASWNPMWPLPLKEDELRKLESALLDANPTATDLRLRVRGLPDAFALDLSGFRNLSDIGPLEGLPIASLGLSQTRVRDLWPLRGMPLKSLSIVETQVETLAPLAGLPLAKLGINRTRVRDLIPLKGCPLASFGAYDTQIEDLSPLADCPLVLLAVPSTRVRFLPKFTAGKLRLLQATNTRLEDLSPLAGQPVEFIGVSRTNVRDFSPLKECPKLNFLGIPDHVDPAAVAAALPDVPSVVTNPDWTEHVAPVYRRISEDIDREVFPPFDPSIPVADLYNRVAALILRRDFGDAVHLWQSEAPDLKIQDPEATAQKLQDVCELDNHILKSLRDDVGQTVKLRLRNETLTCELLEVGTNALKVMAIVKAGNATARIRRTVGIDELSPQEKLKRLGDEKSPELDVMRGLVAVDAGREDVAEKLFQRAGNALGDALIAQLAERKAAGRDADAEQAFLAMLRIIARTTRSLKRNDILTEIRAKCWKSNSTVKRGWELLENFEKQYGETRTGKAAAELVREALTYPFPGLEWKIPDVGTEFVWVEPLGLWMGKYEVTNGEYRAYQPRHRHSVRSGDRYPVSNVSMVDAGKFASWLANPENAPPGTPDGWIYRLPTDEEWLAVARCGSRERRFPWGDNWPPEYGNYGPIQGYDERENDTCPVEESGKNDWGIYGIGGNVWEWTVVGDGNVARRRGAAYNTSDKWQTQCKHRQDWHSPNNGAHDTGFRLVLAPVKNAGK
jgi:serine/threonine-protein kinase